MKQKHTICFAIFAGIMMLNPNVGYNYDTMAVNGADISYEIKGDKTENPPLLLIQGYGCTKDMWPDDLIHTLSETRRLILFDNRGMGLSSPGTDDFSIKLFASDINGLLNSLNIDKVDILGWSLGSMIGMQTALDYPEKVNKLIVHAGYCGGDGAVRPPNHVYDSLLDISGTIEERTERMFANLFPKKWIQEVENPAINFPEITEPVNDEQIVRQGKALLRWEGICGDVQRIGSDTLFVTGSEDIVIPPENSERLAQTLPNASVIVIPGGGHGVMYQYPRQFTEYIERFLEKSG